MIDYIDGNDIASGAEKPTTVELKRAREIIEDGFTRLDDDALVSETPGGLWVQAWVWLGSEE